MRWKQFSSRNIERWLTTQTSKCNRAYVSENTKPPIIKECSRPVVSWWKRRPTSSNVSPILSKVVTISHVLSSTWTREAYDQDPSILSEQPLKLLLPHSFYCLIMLLPGTECRASNKIQQLSLFMLSPLLIYCYLNPISGAPWIAISSRDNCIKCMHSAQSQVVVWTSWSLFVFLDLGIKKYN